MGGLCSGDVGGRVNRGSVACDACGAEVRKWIVVGDAGEVATLFV